MYKATQEFVLGDTIITEGEILKTVSKRMIDLGLVVPFETTAEVREAPVVHEVKSKRTKKTQDEGMVLLTEVSETVEVQKADE